MAFNASSLLRVVTRTGRRGSIVKQAATVRVRADDEVRIAEPKVVAEAISVVSQRSVHDGGVPYDKARESACQLDDLQVEAVEPLGHGVVLSDHRGDEVHGIRGHPVVDTSRQIEEFTVTWWSSFRDLEALDQLVVACVGGDVLGPELLADVIVEGLERRAADEVHCEQVGYRSLLLGTSSRSRNRSFLVQYA